MNQHFVPRVYLKNFATEKGAGLFVDVFDKKANRYFSANINRICSEIDIYTLEEGNKFAEDLFAIEKIYANGIEPLYNKAYSLLTNNNVRWISEFQRVEILIGLFQFYLRNPRLLKRGLANHKTEILRRCNEAKHAFQKGITYLNIDFSFREWTTEAIIEYVEKLVTKEYKEKHVGGLNEIGSFHIDAKFEVAIIKNDAEFITSDNPLVLQDYLGNEENPLQKSKEFIISLNKKTAVRLYHDNSKRRNEVYRHWMPNGSVAMQNNTIQSQASRFVIGSRQVLDDNARISRDFLENTSVELKVDMMRQVIAKIPTTEQNRDAHAVLIEYLRKYDQNGTLTDLEQYEMTIKIRALQDEFIRKRIR